MLSEFGIEKIPETNPEESEIIESLPDTIPEAFHVPIFLLLSPVP